jgi:hypothetical protein
MPLPPTFRDVPATDREPERQDIFYHALFVFMLVHRTTH